MNGRDCGKKVYSKRVCLKIDKGTCTNSMTERDTMIWARPRVATADAGRPRDRRLFCAVKSNERERVASGGAGLLLLKKPKDGWMMRLALFRFRLSPFPFPFPLSLELETGSGASGRELLVA